MVYNQETQLTQGVITRLTKSEIFLELYKQLEQSAIDAFDLPSDGSAISRMERMAQFSSLRGRIKYCREVRALLQHQPKIDGNFAVIPSDEMIDMLRGLISRVKAPAKCYDIAVKRRDVLTARMEDSVCSILLDMRRRGITSTPIVNENDRVIGVFSEDAVISYLLDDGIGTETLDDRLTISDISTYTTAFKRGHIIFRFISKDFSVYNAEKLFYSSLKNGERIGLLLLTETGQKNEPLLGIITPWDIIIP